jgi:uncharacterized protein YeaO (DUF488 family)
MTDRKSARSLSGVLWPRGVSKERAATDLWMKEVFALTRSRWAMFVPVVLAQERVWPIHDPR